MHLHLDHSSPVPLYHQIAEAIRYRIATGDLPEGCQLPALRDAARLWGANLHTVRRAYGELAEAGIVETHAARGTVVLTAATAGRRGRSSGADLDAFLDGVAGEAKLRYGLDQAGLIAELERRMVPSPSPADGLIYVAECSDTQSADLAGQLMARWDVRAVPWRVDREEPPAGHPIVATYFHFNDVRRRWAGRLSQVHFLAIRPDPELKERLMRATEGRESATAILCERDASMLHNILADVSRLLPEERIRVRPQISRAPEKWFLSRRSPVPVLFSPRVWGELSSRARNDPRAIEARFIFEPKDLESIGATMGWSARRTTPGRAPSAP